MLTCFSFCVTAKAQKGYSKSVIKAGIRVDFSLLHVNSENPANEFREGENVRFRFKISDTVSGKGLSGVSPAAWMDKVKGREQFDCRKKIKSYIEGGFLTRPELDLNTYYVLTLNDDNTINVVNPLFGFGGSQLLAQIQLPASGYDWVMKEDHGAVFVSMPEARQVAFISTSEMKVVQNVSIPGNPRKLLLQADEHYLWVTYDLKGEFEAKSGVAIIDVEKKILVKIIPTGNGPHEIVFGEENKCAYISNQNAGTISVIDIQSLRKIKDVKVKDTPISMAYSLKAQALYVVNQKSSVISVIDGKSQQIITEIEAEAGISKMRFASDGRIGFVINPQRNTVNILDAAINKIVQTGDVEAEPDEVSFTDKLAYVRHKGSEIISMIPLDGIGQENSPLPVAEFIGGQNPPAHGAPECGALGIVQTPGDNSVLISNYKDQAIYYYQEGMAAPMGSFNAYGKYPKAVLVIDRSIKEKGDGVYETVAQMGSPGVYNLGLYINVPLILECFEINVLPDPLKEKERLQSVLGSSLSIKYLSTNTRPNVGETVAIKFQMIDINTNQPVSGLKDINLMEVMTIQNNHNQTVAKETNEKGTYLASVKFHDEGLYYLYVECQSRGLSYNNPQFLILYASNVEGIK